MQVERIPDLVDRRARRGWPAPERFMAFVMPEPNSGCWLWLGCCGRRDYGHFKLGSDRAPTRAPRFAYELTHGPIPAGQIVRHRCDTPLCVNPDHLVAGTHQDNADDRSARGRSRHQVGAEHHQARLTECDVRAIRVDRRAQHRIAASYGISQGHVSDIKARKRWAHVG